MLQTSEDIASSSHHSTTSLLRTNAAADPVIHQGALSCHDVKQKVATGEWSDPNRGRIYAREVITFPHFRISLHNEEYDNVRWKTIMQEGKYYEDEVHARFVDILDKEPRSYVVDVGANIGYYTLLSVALGHDVISFEPNPANILRLCDSLRLNDWSSDAHVHIFQNAVSDTEGEMNLFVPKNPGAATLKGLDEHLDADQDHQAKTQVVTLDTFAQEQGWFDRKDFTIALLKIDVEGKDPQVVLGASRLLKSGIVKNVLTEGRRFGRPNIFDSFVSLFEAGFTLKEPVVTMKGKSPKEHAQSVVDYYQEKFGKNSMRTADLWWIKE
jgi:FkbM family methyltransferase